MNKPFAFDHSYRDYWQDRVDCASDGTRIPGISVAAALVERMQIRSGERVLDVGCCFGRLLPILTPYTSEVFGLELSYEVVDMAAKQPYHCVVRGSAEDTNLPSEYFSHLVLFGVFDCCDQVRALRELRRLLVTGGIALITGKNANYEVDDHLALVAERNAWRKSFPNSFTHVSSLRELLPEFGFELAELHCFARRGDFGEMRALQQNSPAKLPFYEYAVLLRAIGEPPPALPAINAHLVSSRTSEAARQAAAQNGFASVEDFFSSDVLDDLQSRNQ
jgi:SAM-dependent methyltransferase